MQGRASRRSARVEYGAGTSSADSAMVFSLRSAMLLARSVGRRCRSGSVAARVSGAKQANASPRFDLGSGLSARVHVQLYPSYCKGSRVSHQLPIGPTLSAPPLSSFLIAKSSPRGRIELLSLSYLPPAGKNAKDTTTPPPRCSWLLIEKCYGSAPLRMASIAAAAPPQATQGST